MSAKDYIIELLERDAKRTHSSIAREVGVSREYVRQVDALLGHTGRERQEAAKGERPWKRSHRFQRAIRKWLQEVGYDYCYHGKHVVPRQDGFMYSHGGFSCRECNARRANERNHQIGKWKSYYPVGYGNRKYAIEKAG